MANSQKSQGRRNSYSKSKKEFDKKGSGKGPRNSTSNNDCTDPRASNDISWYVPDVNILRDAASIPFSETLGAPLHLRASGIGTGHAEVEVDTPGLCVLDLAPSLGRLYNGDPDFTQLSSDPINVSAKAIYSFVRHANSGSSNYEASDLMMYIMAMDNVYMIWSWLVRMYGVARTYNFYNKYTPESILHGMGIDNPRQLASVLADLRALINTTAIRMSSFAVPTVLPYIKRHLWLYQNVFVDSESIKAQMYMFNPSVYYIYNEVNGSLDPVEMPRIDGTTGPKIIEQLTAIVESALEPIITSESIGIMSGDILKAYTASNVYGFATIDENYTVVPAYVPGVLPQIHNAVLYGIGGAQMGAIVQDKTGTSNIGQTYTFAGQIQPHTTVLNTPNGDTTPDGVMYATRLMVLADNAHGPLFTGSEIVTDMHLYQSATNHARRVDTSITHYAWIDRGQARAEIVLQLSSVLAKFSWAPQLYFYSMNGNVPSGAVYNWTNYDTFTTVDGATLRKIHDCAISGEFGIPVSLTRG